jgi:MFS transporter, SHS family, sialic acid transporter
LLVGAAPGAVGILILALVPESLRWLSARDAASAATRPARPMREVLTPPLLYRTLLGVSLGAIPLIGTAANASWLTPWTDHVAQQKIRADEEAEGNEQQQSAKANAARQKAKTQITRSGGAIFGSLLGGIIASIVGRRLTYFLISLGALGISSYIYTQIDPLHPQFHLFSFLLGFVGVTYFGWLPLFLPELFPTRVRSTGAGISFNTGRIVAACIVLSTGFWIDLFQGDYARIGFWSGMIYAVGMLIIWFAPQHEIVHLED